MMEAYTHLHEQGFAASVEVWEEEQLVGGLYGVTLGRCFLERACSHSFPAPRSWPSSIWPNSSGNMEAS